MKKLLWKINDWISTPEADRILGVFEVVIGALYIANGTKEYVKAQLKIDSK